MNGVAFFLIWVILSFAVSLLAVERGRSALGFGLLSLVLSPIVGGLILLLIPDLAREARQRAKDRRLEEMREWDRMRERERESVTRKAVTADNTPTIPTVAPLMPTIEELERLASLRDRGVITEAEFAQQKARVLGG